MRWAASAAGVDFAGMLERNLTGDMRTEVYLANSPSACFATIWSAQNHLMTFLDYRRRLASTALKPRRYLSSTWTFGHLNATWSGEHQTILGQDARKIVLWEKGGQPGAGQVGCCWVSEVLGLVLDERVTIMGAPATWRAWELELREPGRDLLQIPVGVAETTRRDQE
jgi:hypothetical protein